MQGETQGPLKPRRAVSRQPLRRSTIVLGAVTIARSEGVDAVTMRRVAAALHTSPMSLYRHVADRQQLLLDMLGVVAESVELPPPSESPRAELVAVVTAIHDALQIDPWAVTLIVGDRLASPKIIPAIDRIFGALARAGLSPRDISMGYALLWHYTVGELFDRHHLTPDDFGRTMIQQADPTQYPALVSVMDALGDQTPRDHFQESVQRILDGLGL